MKRVLLFIAVTSAFAQDQTGGVRGIIVDAATHQPVRKATVSLQFLTMVSTSAQQISSTSSSQPGDRLSLPGAKSKPQSVVSDASGAFAIDQVQPGLYRLLVFHEQYPLSRFGPSPIGKSFTINSGETAGPITAELVPGAAISGHIYDEDGDPLNGCNIQLHPAKHPEQNVMTMAGPQVVPAEEGAYRLFGVSPGKYVLQAQCQIPVFQARPLSAGPDPPPALGYQALFYPAGDTIETAETIELAAGTERRSADFRMKSVPMTTIEVRLNGAEWRGRKDLSWRLAAIGPNASNRGQQVDTSKDVFQISRVFPGSYTLQVSTGGFAPTAGAAVQTDGPAVAGMQRVDVRDKPVQVTVELRQAVDIAGMVQIETTGAQPAPASNPTPLSPRQINIQLMPQNPLPGPRSGASVQEDGTFTMKSVLPLPSRLVVNAASGFMKSAWFGNTEIIGGLIDPSVGGGPLRIVVSTNTASLAGTAPPGSQVVVMKVENFPSAVSRGTQTDASGQFRIDGLAPGTYRVYGLEAPGPPLDEGGQEITLQEGETRTMEVKPQ